MAMMCEVCQGQGRLAFRLHQAGKRWIRSGLESMPGTDKLPIALPL